MGGTLQFERIHQMSGVFLVEAGTMNGGLFTHGNLVFGQGSNITVGALVLANNATMTVNDYGKVTIPAAGTLQIDGTQRYRLGQ